MNYNQIAFYLFANPTYIGQSYPFQIGWKNSTGQLSNITTACIIQVLDPAKGINIIQASSNMGYIAVQGTQQNISVYLKVIYYDTVTEQIYFNYFSFCFVQDSKNITVQDLYRNFVNYLPIGVYTQTQDPLSPVYDDNIATVTALAQIYDSTQLQETLGNTQEVAFEDLNTIIASFFPDSGNPNWEYALNGTTYLYNQSQTYPSSNYNALLTLLYQLNTNNNTNSYYLAYNISQYIYYRLGSLFYVLIGENNINVVDAFILNLNQLSECIFNNGNNFPGTNENTISIFILNGSSLSDEFQAELTNFIRKIIPPYLFINVYFTYVVSDFGLTYIGETYWKDPNQNNIACIQYNPNVLAQALGYAGHDSTDVITSFTVSLSPTPGMGNVLTNGQQYTVTLIPNMTPTLPFPLICYAEFYTSDSAVLSQSFDNTPNEYFNANSIGSATMTIYLGVTSQIITYTVV